MCAPSVGHLVPALVRAKQAIRSIAGRPAHGAGKRSHGVAFGGTRGARAPKEFALGQRSAAQARAGDTGRAEVITREQLTSGNITQRSMLADDSRRFPLAGNLGSAITLLFPVVGIAATAPS